MGFGYSIAIQVLWGLDSALFHGTGLVIKVKSKEVYHNRLQGAHCREYLYGLLLFDDCQSYSIHHSGSSLFNNIPPPPIISLSLSSSLIHSSHFHHEVPIRLSFPGRFDCRRCSGFFLRPPPMCRMSSLHSPALCCRAVSFANRYIAIQKECGTGSTPDYCQDFDAKCACEDTKFLMGIACCLQDKCTMDQTKGTTRSIPLCLCRTN